MLLFISHASEDQRDFVKPLADELAKIFDVWYAPYQLSLGDSLFQRISEGLTQCDFGVVVLSHAFFSKKWPQAELDGLYALESTSRKIILPVLKDITIDEVAKYSPIIAGKLCVSASDGLSRVVEEIRIAVDVSERKRQLTVVGSAMQRLKLLDQSLNEKTNSERLLSTAEGLALVNQSVDTIYNSLEHNLSNADNASGELKFTFSRGFSHGFNVSGPARVHLIFSIANPYNNCAHKAILDLSIQLPKSRLMGTDPIELENVRFKPMIRALTKVVWVALDGKNIAFEADEFVGYAIDLFTKAIEQQISKEK